MSFSVKWVQEYLLLRVIGKVKQISIFSASSIEPRQAEVREMLSLCWGGTGTGRSEPGSLTQMALGGRLGPG